MNKHRKQIENLQKEYEDNVKLKKIFCEYLYNFINISDFSFIKTIK